MTHSEHNIKKHVYYFLHKEDFERMKLINLNEYAPEMKSV